jgi:arabinose-5-phosphate isomerase
MSSRRAGAAVVVNEDGTLLGIFTHGDFARHFQRDATLGEAPVERFITRQPITVGSERLAAEVLHILDRHRIDDLVVVDDQQRPIGVVDSQDLARFKLL